MYVFVFVFFLTLDSHLTKWLSRPNLKAQHKTSSCLMACSGVCSRASIICLLVDSTLERSHFHCPTSVEKDMPGHESGTHAKYSSIPYPILGGAEMGRIIEEKLRCN